MNKAKYFLIPALLLLPAQLRGQAPATAQPATPTPPTPKPQPPVAKPTTPKVVATVNGRQILDTVLEDTFKQALNAQMGGRPVPPALMEQARARLRPQILEQLIGDELIIAAAESAKISVSEADLVAEMEKGLRGYLVRTGSSREEFAKQIQADEGTSLEAFIKKRALDPKFKQSVVHSRLLEKVYPDDLKITPEEIKSNYEKQREQVYTQPELVRASHILFPIELSKSDDEKAAVKKKADEVLAEARKPGSDFAALAAKHSSCPSKQKGGDLNFFPREGVMVDPFAAAAFGMKKGQMSELVQTRFGYHIILVTDRKTARVISLAQASEDIELRLRAQKLGAARQKHVELLKKSAKIVYPEEKKPAVSG